MIRKLVNAWGLVRRGLLLNQVRWDLVRGESTLRLNYGLDEHSTVFDLGGYEGNWTDAIFTRYGCTIHVFEPVDEFAARLESRFRDRGCIHVHPFGLAGRTRAESISIDGISSSTFVEAHATQQIRLVKATDFIQANGIDGIDLMKVNIQGGEYELLDHLIASRCILRIKDLQVQFHDFVPDAKEKMRGIQQRLLDSHFLTYQYLFIFENWRRREPTSPPAHAAKVIDRS